MAYNKKQFKDPIYGYIEIDSRIVGQIIDSPAFQRLKDIRQTSYTPLFPAAYHNRYIHSLGVYHLGQIAFQAIEPQIQERMNEAILGIEMNRIKDIFELACLLHDVGHAPFSHTGEIFFDHDRKLHSLLKSTVNDDQFSVDFDQLGTNKPANHECMSCIVALKTFPTCFQSQIERSLFARCIIGMQIRFSEKPPAYSREISEEKKKEVTQKINEINKRQKGTELLNCVISLLNSSIIDVDRLDYIIRDAATIGFKSVQVDYIRLLNGMRIVECNRKPCIGYHKSALSVIESAVYAHDAEKKWVQTHPAILYEMEALKNAMAVLTQCFQSDEDPNPIFCYEALTEAGKVLRMRRPLFSEEARQLLSQDELWTERAKQLEQEGKLFSQNGYIDLKTGEVISEYPISLLADEDFLYLMKLFCKDGLGYEYFARNRRRTPVWKSEAEFRALFQVKIGDKSEAIKTLEKDFDNLSGFCQTKTGAPLVDHRVFGYLDQEEKGAEDSKEKGEIPDQLYEDLIEGVRVKRRLAKALKEVAEELNIEFEFLVVVRDKFKSSFKETLGDIPILFPNVEPRTAMLKNVIDVIGTKSDLKSNFFHLFYRQKEEEHEVEKRKIVNEIAKKLIALTTSP